MIHRRTFVSLAAATALVPVLPAFAQQPWPTHFVRVIVPFTPGGGIDAIGRVVGARLSEMWGQQVIVENKPGAGGNIASELVARADPDGHTLYISAAGIAVNQFLFPSINYDPVNDFASVSLLCFFPNLLVVPPASPFKSAYVTAMARFMEDWDFLVTPTVSVAAFPAELIAPKHWPQHPWDWIQWAEFSYPFNHAGNPAASVPCGFTADGLPVGLQIVGKRHDDLGVLQLAHAFGRPAVDAARVDVRHRVLGVERVPVDRAVVDRQRALGESALHN